MINTSQADAWTGCSRRDEVHYGNGDWNTGEAIRLDILGIRASRWTERIVTGN